jgi:hypothetical protein
MVRRWRTVPISLSYTTPPPACGRVSRIAVVGSGGVGQGGRSPAGTHRAEAGLAPAVDGLADAGLDGGLGVGGCAWGCAVSGLVEVRLVEGGR